MGRILGIIEDSAALTLLVMVGFFVALILSIGIFIDYWNGSARASLIAKRGGPELTWREGAQIKQIEINDLNVAIRFDSEKAKQ